MVSVALPPGVVTVTFLADRVALLMILNVAVICVELTTVTFVIVKLPPDTAIVAPGTKLLPVRVTVNGPEPKKPEPLECEIGFMAVRVGGGGFWTVNPLFRVAAPPDVVTVMFRVPNVALEAMVSVAVIV